VDDERGCIFLGALTCALDGVLLFLSSFLTFPARVNEAATSLRLSSTLTFVRMGRTELASAHAVSAVDAGRGFVVCAREKLNLTAWCPAPPPNVKVDANRVLLVARACGGHLDSAALRRVVMVRRLVVCVLGAGWSGGNGIC